MEIKIGIGLDNIIFGMTQEDIINILGSPDKMSETEISYGLVYSYNNKMIKLKFDRDEELRLTSIEVYCPGVKMFNQKIIGKTKDQIIGFLEEKHYKEPKYEEYDFFETLFYEEIWATFEFEFSKLRCIEFSPLLENDEIIWP